MRTSTKQMKMVPELRFFGFSESYNRYLFEDIFLFSTGKNIKQNEASPEFTTPCVRYGELYYMYGEVISKIVNKTNLDTSELSLSKGNEILLPSAGEDPMDIGSASALILKNVAIGRTINILRPAKDNILSQVYVAYYINQRLRGKISTLAKGHSISNVYNSDLKKLEIILPSQSEQQKIADFLGSVDAWLDNLRQQKTALETYKRGMMQKLFTQQVRFKDENGNNFPKWQEKKLSDLLDYKQPTEFIVESTEYKDGYKTPVLTAGKSFILGYTNETKGVYSYELPVIIFDDFTTATQFVDFSFKVKSSAMKILVPMDGNHVTFLYEAIQRIKFDIGGHGRQWISKYSKLTIEVPSLAEQQKIADFVSSLNKLIADKSKEIAKVERWKKGLMQKMFI